MVRTHARRSCGGARAARPTPFRTKIGVSWPTQARWRLAAAAVTCSLWLTCSAVGDSGDRDTAARVAALLDGEDVDGAVALAQSRPVETRGALANWLSAEARVEAEMGIHMPTDTICAPAYVPLRDGSGGRVLARQQPAECAVNATAAREMRMVHYMRVHLANGTTIPVHIPRHGRHQHGALPAVGLFTPIAGIVHRGELYAARDPVECQPLARGSPARNCSIGGVWRVYGSRAEATQARVHREAASHAAQRAKYGLPMLRTNGVVDAAMEAAIAAGSGEVKTGPDGKRYLQNGVRWG
jgi:hypothetical protein